LKSFICSLMLGVVAAAISGMPTRAAAQVPGTYPVKPVRIICVTAPGGGLDIIGRLVADRLTKTWGQTVIFENRPGAGGNIATEYVAKTAADGYTLLETTNNHNINTFLFKNPGYDARKDFVPVVQFTEAPSVLITHAQSPFRSLKDVINAAKSQPGKLSYGHAGSGQGTHIAGEMFKRAANIDITAIPYKGGGPANIDVMAGQIPLAMGASPAVTPLVKAGRVRALAVTSEKRWPTLPDVPSVAELGYDKFSHYTWIGILAPAGTPPAIVSRLNKEIATLLVAQDVRERIVATGAKPVGGSSTDFEAMLKTEYETTKKLVVEIGLKAE